ncbi:MAG: helix-turn-helix domain-containing protein [Candidatus Hodarchaeota archaeon]
MLYSFLLEIQYQNEISNSFANFSLLHPRVEIQLWCNSQNDIIELKGETQDLEVAIANLEKDLGEVIKIYPDRNHIQLVFKLCKCTKFPLDKVLSKYDCLELPPTKYFSGREILNLIVTPEDAGSILDDIRVDEPDAQINVLRLAPLKSTTDPYPFYLPLEELRKNFTKKQQEALSIAYKKGYYDIPRAMFLENLAKEMNIKRRTYEEHLRKAEKKIMSFLVPALLSF